MPLKLEIVSPERLAYTDEVDMVIVPGIDGQLGILPHHTRLISALGVGERRLVPDSARHTAEQRRHLGSRLREAEDVVDEEQDVLAVVASRWANEAAGAGSVRSSAGT